MKREVVYQREGESGADFEERTRGMRRSQTVRLWERPWREPRWRYLLRWWATSEWFWVGVAATIAHHVLPGLLP